jgi:hypothetical protein
MAVEDARTTASAETTYPGTLAVSESVASTWTAREAASTCPRQTGAVSGAAGQCRKGVESVPWAVLSG